MEKFIAADQSAEIRGERTHFGVVEFQRLKLGAIRLEEVTGFRLFGFTRCPAQGLPPGLFHATGFIGSLADKTNGPFLRLGVNKRVVKKVQRLRGNSRREPVGRRRIGVAAVEESEVGMPLETLAHQINAAFVVVVNRRERPVLRVSPGKRRGKGMLRGDG